MLDTLLTTLIREMLNEGVEGRKVEAKLVARRFVRSVARIFVVLNVELTPQSGKKRRYVGWCCLAFWGIEGWAHKQPNMIIWRLCIMYIWLLFSFWAYTGKKSQKPFDAGHQRAINKEVAMCTVCWLGHENISHISHISQVMIGQWAKIQSFYMPQLVQK